MTSIQAGCNDYVVKPFDKTIVAKKLTQLGFHVKLF
jgi:YesN/AraC family two-component response regulator